MNGFKPTLERTPSTLFAGLVFASLGWGLVYGLNHTFTLGLNNVTGGLAALPVGAALALLDRALPRRLFRLLLITTFTLVFFEALVTVFHTLLFLSIVAFAFMSVVFGNPVGMYVLGFRAGRRRRA